MNKKTESAAAAHARQSRDAGAAGDASDELINRLVEGDGRDLAAVLVGVLMNVIARMTIAHGGEATRLSVTNVVDAMALADADHRAYPSAGRPGRA